MSEKINPADNILDSLRRVAHELEKGPAGSALSLKGFLGWGWHAAALLAYIRLRPGKELFDAWMQDYLQEGTPIIDVERDARWEERQRLSLLELLDIISEESLPSLKPEFYQGWQDRMSRCRWVRGQAQRLIGGSINAKWRDDLLLLLAAYHRLIRLPAAVEIDFDGLYQKAPALLNLCEMLIDRSSPDAEKLIEMIGRCRTALSSGAKR